MPKKSKLQQTSIYWVMFLASLGGACEMYDFIVYIYLTPYLSAAFFPSQNSFLSTLNTFIVFAIGYLVRPLGGMLFGHLGDRLGRKRVFIITIILMSCPIFLMGLLPTVANIGWWASALLVLLRMLQGIALGGEIPGAMTFTTEYVPAHKRGLAGGAIFSGINCGLAFAALMVAILGATFSQSQIYAFAWRFPFLLGGLLGLVAAMLRTRAEETPAFIALRKRGGILKFPLKELLHKHWRTVLIGISISCTGAALIIIGFTYAKPYLVEQLHYSLSLVSWLLAISVLISAGLQIYFGHLSDRFGRLRILAIGLILLCVFILPIYYLFTLNSALWLTLAMLSLSIISAVIIGVYPTLLIELFPAEVRYSGYAFAYNIVFAFVGGLSPVIVSLLLHITHNLLMPGFYLLAISLFSLVVLGWLGFKKKNYSQIE